MIQLKNSNNFCLLFLIVSLTCSCGSSKQRKSADYYNENKQSINEMRSVFDQLYNHQVLSVGFTDKSFKYYVMEVTTDTLRYIYNTHINEQQLYETVKKFRYDTIMLKKLSNLMKSTKCLWLSKSSFYISEKRETVTYLSFKSAKTDRPFVENKYFILIFLPYPLTSADIKAKINNGDLVKIDDLVYFMIGNKYR